MVAKEFVIKKEAYLPGPPPKKIKYFDVESKVARDWIMFAKELVMVALLI